VEKDKSHRPMWLKKDGTLCHPFFIFYGLFQEGSKEIKKTF